MADTVWVVRWLADGFVKQFNLERSAQRIDCCDCFSDHEKLYWRGFKIKRHTVYSRPGYFGYEYEFGLLDPYKNLLTDKGQYYPWIEKPWNRYKTELHATEWVVKEIGVDD